MIDIRPKEKILLFGGSNSGKTHAELLFIQAVIAGGHRGFIIDADDGAIKLIAEMDEFALLRDALGTQLQIVPAYDYDGALAAVVQYKSRFKPTPGDVVSLEMVGNLWDWSQAQFTNTVKHESVAQLQLDKAESGRLQYGGLDGRSEWPVIKKLYMDITVPTLQSPAHVIWTAAAKDLVPDNDKIDTMEMFGSVKQKYEGEKNSHYKMDTVIHLSYDRRTQTRSWSSLKDRGKRPLMPKIQYTDLFESYYAMHDLTPPWTRT